MKFDVVIGNPPFQDSSHNEKKNTLWRKFIDRAHTQLLDSNGIVALIVPSSWVGSQKMLNKYFLPYDLQVINKDECRRHFPGIGSSFSYYVMCKRPYQHHTQIVNKEIDGTIVTTVLDLDDVLCGAIPRNMSVEAVSIIKKVLHSGHPKLGIINACTHHNVKRDSWKKTQEGTFIYPIQNTPTSVYFYDYPHPDQGVLKVAIPTSTYYRNMILTTHGVTQGLCYFNVPSNVNENIVLSNMKNKTFDFVNECFRYSNWNSVPVLRSLPTIPFDRRMDDMEIYSYFKLTNTEIDEIERNIK